MYWFTLYVVCPVLLWLLACVLWRQYISSTRDASCPLPLPPGSDGWPIVGEMLHFIMEGIRGDFFDNRRQRYGPIYRSHLFGHPVVRVSSGDIIRQILIKEYNVVDNAYPKTVRTLLGEKAVTGSNGLAHRPRRKCALHAFTRDALRSYHRKLVPLMQSEMRQWIANQSKHLAYVQNELLALKAATTVLLGVQLPFATLLTMSKDFELYVRGLFTIPLNIPGSPYYKALKAKKRIQDEFQPYLDELLARIDVENPSSGLEHVLTSRFHQWGELGEGVDPVEIQDWALEFLFAGHQTVTSASTFVIYHLARNPEVLARLRAELDAAGDIISYEFLTECAYLEYVVREVLRLDPPAGGGYRRAKTTLEVGGYQIPKDWNIIFSIVDTHKYSPLVKDVEAFRPERWASMETNRNLGYTYLPFGVGPRSCVGKAYAVLYLKVFAATLVKNYDWTLHNPDVAISRFPVRHPVDLLPVTLQPRNKNLGYMTVVENGHAGICCDINANTLIKEE